MKNIDSIIPISDEGLYPIRTVSEVSGVNAITLRAWERRYGLFTPKRTPKGHRLYSEKDIQCIQQVLALLAKGVSIGRVAKALKHAPIKQGYTNQIAKIGNCDEPTQKQWIDYQETLLKIINGYDIVLLESFHHELLSVFPIETVSQQVISPVFNTLRNRAEQLPSISGNYHFYKIFLAQRLGGFFLKSSVRNKGKKIVLMSIDNSQSDVELLLFAMPLLRHGYQFIVLGSDVAYDAIPMALSASHAEGIILFSNSDVSGKLSSSDFHTVVSSLDTPVFILGDYSELKQQELLNAGMIILPQHHTKQISIINKHT